MKKLILFLLVCLPVIALAEDCPVCPKQSIFSTSVDWEAVSRLRLSQYKVDFKSDKKLVKNGLELYVFDGFPCYGLTESVSVWISPRGEVVGRGGFDARDMRLVCLFEPTTLQFAWRNVERDAYQGPTTGILSCPVETRGRDINVNLAKCTVGPTWDEIKKNG